MHTGVDLLCGQGKKVELGRGSPGRGLQLDWDLSLKLPYDTGLRVKREIASRKESHELEWNEVGTRKGLDPERCGVNRT